jgi:hypothetical protein
VVRRPLRLHHVFEIAQALARRVDQHRHIAGLVAVGAHQLVGVGNLLPRKYIAHARIDAAIDDELVGGVRLAGRLTSARAIVTRYASWPKSWAGDAYLRLPTSR